MRHGGDTAAAVKRRARPRKARIRFPFSDGSAYFGLQHRQIREGSRQGIVLSVSLRGEAGSWIKIIHECVRVRGNERSIW